MRRNRPCPRVAAGNHAGAFGGVMKVKDITVFVVGNPPPYSGGRYFIFVKLTTDDGIEGVGEVYSATFGPQVVKAMIEDVFEQLRRRRPVPHRDPVAQRLWPRLLAAAGHVADGRARGLEIACWDIIGKADGKPVYELLGGRVHERLRTYTYIYPDGRRGREHLSQRRRRGEARGGLRRAGLHRAEVRSGRALHHLRSPPALAGGLDLAEKFCSLLREAVGTKADLLFGTHGQFTASGAIRLARRLEAYDPLWFEEPVPPEMPEEMARVARQTTIPIATGERLCTKYEFSRVLALQAASILQMALGRVGGMLEAKKIAGMAEAHYAQIAPHLYCGPIEGAANIQLAACSPNFLILESIERWEGFHADILVKPIVWEDGYVIPPTAPGLGVELNEAVALAHPYEGTALHLVPTPPHRLTAEPAMRYGFIGLGHLGAPLAASLCASGLRPHRLRHRSRRSRRRGGGRALGREHRGGLRRRGRHRHLPALAHRFGKGAARDHGSCAPRRRTWIEMSTNGREEIIRLAGLADGRRPRGAGVPR